MKFELMRLYLDSNLGLASQNGLLEVADAEGNNIVIPCRGIKIEMRANEEPELTLTISGKHVRIISVYEGGPG